MTIKLAFNTAEAAQACGVSKDTIKRAIHAGHLRASKTGRDKNGDPTGSFVIMAKALEEWLEGLAAA